MWFENQQLYLRLLLKRYAKSIIFAKHFLKCQKTNWKKLFPIKDAKNVKA